MQVLFALHVWDCELSSHFLLHVLSVCLVSEFNVASALFFRSSKFVRNITISNSIKQIDARLNWSGTFILLVCHWRETNWIGPIRTFLQNFDIMAQTGNSTDIVDIKQLIFIRTPDCHTRCNLSNTSPTPRAFILWPVQQWVNRLVNDSVLIVCQYTACINTLNTDSMQTELLSPVVTHS